MRLPVQAIGLLAAALYVPCHSAAAVVALSPEGVQAFTNGTLSVAVMSLPELDVAVSYEHELIVNFYSDACEHCETLAPELSAMARLLHAEAPEATVVSVDVSADPAGAREVYGVRPAAHSSLVFLRASGRAHTYPPGAARDGAALLVWAQRLLAPAYAVVDDASALLAGEASDGVTRVLCFVGGVDAPTAAAVAADFVAAAEALHAEHGAGWRFALVLDAAAAAAHGAAAEPAIVVRLDGREVDRRALHLLDGPEAAAAFVEAASGFTPHFSAYVDGEIDRLLHADRSSAAAAAAPTRYVLVFGDAAAVRAVRGPAEAAAAQGVGRDAGGVKFAWVPESDAAMLRFSGLAGVPKLAFPEAVFVDASRGPDDVRRYRLPPGQLRAPATEVAMISRLVALARGGLDDALPRLSLSEAGAAAAALGKRGGGGGGGGGDADPVRRLVGSEFEAAVLREARDVVLLFYAKAACGAACHQVLAAARAAAAACGTKVVFAYIDHTANDVALGSPDVVPGIDPSEPAVFLVRANNRDRPVAMRGGMTSAEGFLKLVEVYASRPFHAGDRWFGKPSRVNKLGKGLKGLFRRGKGGE